MLVWLIWEYPTDPHLEVRKFHSHKLECKKEENIECIHTVVPPYLQGIRSKTPSKCVKLQIVTKPYEYYVLSYIYILYL